MRFKSKVMAANPVMTHSEDCALQEYDLTKSEMAAAAKRFNTDIKAARKRGEVQIYLRGKS